MQFDETQYVQDFIKKHRGARTVPADLISRYAITLPATDDEISAKIKAVRNYWNRVYQGKSMTAQVAAMCRAEDEKLHARHGAAMETGDWWQQQQSARQSAAEASIKIVATDLRHYYGPLGVVTSGTLDKFATKFNLTSGQTTQAAVTAGLRILAKVTLPEAEPIGNFTTLAKRMSECGAASVQDLIHPDAGPFSIIDRYVCLSDPDKRLDAVAVAEQTAEAERRAISATNNARLAALRILRKALLDDVDLRDVVLYHLMTVARQSSSIGIATAELQKIGLEPADASIIAVLTAEQNTTASLPVPDKMAALFLSGQLREARATALSLPAESRIRLDAKQQVDAAQQQLETLIAEARSAKQVGDQARAALLLRDAAQISAEDAHEELATLQLTPPAQLRAVCDAASVKLSWRPGIDHDADTDYVVYRAQEMPSAPTDGVPVHRGRGDACVDAHAPVSRRVQYWVFAVSQDRPSSMPATISVTLLPPVSRLKAAAGPDSIVLQWSAIPEAQVEVIWTAPGAPPVPVPVTGTSCQVTGLAEGQEQHFEVTAIYRGPGGTELRSIPEQMTVIPRAAAQPIQELRAHAVEASGITLVRITWTPVDNSEVRIVRSNTGSAWPPGHVVSQEEMTEAGTELTGDMITGYPDRGLETILPAGVHQIVPFSIGGTGIVVGCGTKIACIDPVRDLIAEPFATYAKVVWEWPPNAKLAELTWELDDTTTAVMIDLAQYRSEGGARVPLGHGPCTIEVRIVIMVGDTSFASPPVRKVVSEVVVPAISYKVSSVRPFGRRSKKVVFSCDQTCRDVRVKMVAAPGLVMPTSPSLGITLLETTLALQPEAPKKHQVKVPKKVKRPYWVRCFIVEGEARLIDPPILSLKEA
jgi:hypothetical protein